MARADIIEEVPIGLTELKSELKKIKKRDEELTPRSKKLEDYLNQVTQLTKKDYEALVKELTDLNIPRLKDIHIIKIADIVPGSLEELKSILHGYALTVTNSNMKKIVAVTKKYVS
jgi:DNA-directed RNA polymerase subunit F